MLLLGLCLAVPVGCGGSGGSTSGSTSTGKAAAAKYVNPEPGPNLPLPKGPPTKKLVIKDLKVGHGPPAKPGDKVKVQYLGKLWNGEPYTDSWTYQQPPSFTVGGDEIIIGFSRGIRGMRAGGRRRLLIPGQLDTFPGTPTTPASQALVYVVYMLKVSPPH